MKTPANSVLYSEMNTQRVEVKDFESDYYEMP